MEIEYVNVVFRALGFFALVGYVIPVQVMELTRSRDSLTKLRIMLLCMVMFTVMAGLPPFAYQFIGISVSTTELLRQIASLCSAFGFFMSSLLLVFIYNYKRKE